MANHRWTRLWPYYELTAIRRKSDKWPGNVMSLTQRSTTSSKVGHFTKKASNMVLMNKRSNLFYNTLIHTYDFGNRSKDFPPKLGMKLGDNKSKKIARALFYKNFHFDKIWTNVPTKCPFLVKIAVFGTLQKIGSNKFSKIAPKVGPKIVL